MKSMNVFNYGLVVRVENVDTKTGDHFSGMRVWAFREDEEVYHDYMILTIGDFLAKHGDSFRRLLVSENKGLSYVSLKPEVYVSAWKEWIAF